MQTFLPFPDFTATARVLDRKRLGGQRVEALQLFNALTVPGHGWRHHPAAKMWRGYEEALARYALTMCETWTALGHADSVATTLTGHVRDRLGLTVVRSQRQLADAEELPPWLGDERVHRSHRSNLLRKDREHYATHFEDDLPDDLDYEWPSRWSADRS